MEKIFKTPKKLNNCNSGLILTVFGREDKRYPIVIKIENPVANTSKTMGLTHKQAWDLALEISSYIVNLE